MEQIDDNRRLKENAASTLLMEIADEMKAGCDELYAENKADVERMFKEAAGQLASKLKVQQQLAVTEQELRNSKLKNIQLEEDIDSQTDAKILVKQKSAKSRKQIARIIKKT